jgi:hypothetical protein
MRLSLMSLAMVCLLACGNAAWAQSGVSNQRDGSGNLVRDNGTMSPRGVNQGPTNNGPIRNAPMQPATNGIGTAKGAGR